MAETRATPGRTARDAARAAVLVSKKRGVSADRAPFRVIFS